MTSDTSDESYFTRAGKADRLRREQQEQADYSVLSWFNPFSYSFGTLLLFGLLAAGVYFFGFSDKGKQMLGELFKKLPTEWQDRLVGIGEWLGLVPEGGKELAVIARKHGVELGDAISGGAEVFLKPELMYDAMIEAPEAVLKLAKNAPKDKPDDKTTQKAMAAIRTIVSDPQKLATLLDAKNKANTYALLEAVSPIPIKAGALGTFIDKVGMKDGKPTPALQELLLAVLDEKATEASRNAALMTFAQRNPQALSTLLEGVDTTAITDEAQRTQIESAKEQPKASLGPIMKIDANLRKHGTSIGAVAQAADSPESMVELLLNDKQRTAIFKGNAELIGQAMRGYEHAAEAALPGITDPTKRSEAEAQLNFFRLMNTGSPDAQGTWRATNVRAIHTLFAQIDGSAFSASHPKATRQVLAGMLGLMTGDPDASKKLDPTLVAAFFADEKNAAAFGNFFATLNPGRLPGTKTSGLQGLVNTFKNHWGNKDKGLQDILDDRASVAKMIELANNPPQAFQSYPGDWGLPAIANAAGTAFFWNVSGATRDMADNRETIEAITAALQTAGVQQGGAAKPAPRPAGQSASVN